MLHQLCKLNNSQNVAFFIFFESQQQFVGKQHDVTDVFVHMCT